MPINNYKYVHTKLLIFYLKKKKTNILIWVGGKHWLKFGSYSRTKTLSPPVCRCALLIYGQTRLIGYLSVPLTCVTATC
jgi:hypothetical protein